MKRNLGNSIRNIIPLALIGLFISCTRGTPNLNDSEVPSNLHSPSPFSPDQVNGGGMSGASGGSGSGGALTASDQQALQNLTGDFKDVQPSQQEQSPMDPQIQQQLQSIIDQEKQGLNMTAQKIQLAGQMIKQCAVEVAQLAPRAGQPLMGDWQGLTCAAPPQPKKDREDRTHKERDHGGDPGMPSAVFSFHVADPYFLGPGQGTPIQAPRYYTVSGGANGRMAADEQGNGGVDANPWPGNVSDHSLNGRSGMGTLINNQYRQTSGGPQGCTMQVRLQNSQSPIPENYVTAMRKAAQCYRRTLVLMSPVFDAMFGNMDPALADLLRNQMLGLNQGQ